MLSPSYFPSQIEVFRHGVMLKVTLSVRTAVLVCISQRRSESGAGLGRVTHSRQPRPADIDEVVSRNAEPTKHFMPPSLQQRLEPG